MPPTTISDVITNISKIVAEVSIITTVVSLGATQLVKQFTNNSKVIAAFAVIFGFVAGLAIMKIFNGSWTSPMSLLVGGIAAIGAPGVYSVTKTIASSSVSTQTQ